MKLFESIQELKAMQSEAKDALKEAKDATSQSTLQRVFAESFNAELKGLQSRLSEVSNEILGHRANELSTQNKQEILSLFESQKSEIIKEAVERLPLESLSKLIAKDFAKQNKENLTEAINEAIAGTNSELKKTISECRESLRSTTKDFEIATQNKKNSILETADCLIYDFLKENPNLVFENMSQESIKSGIVECLNANPTLLESLNKKALKIAKERISFSLVQEEIQKQLQREAINAFEKALGYQDLIEKRFLAGLQLGALCLLGELGNLSKILSALSDIQTEENRLEALRNFKENAPYQKIFMEI